MNEDKKRINGLFAYFDAIRGNITYSEYLVTLSILKKTAEQESIMGGALSEDKEFEVMRNSADLFESANPFPDKGKFLEAYRAFQNFEEITWADILEYGNANSKFRVPQALVEVMENSFIDGFSEVLIPEAEKFAGSLEKLVAAHFEFHFTLTTMDTFCYKVLNEMFIDNKMVDVKQASIYEYEFTAARFDTILAVPMFGVRDRADENTPFICRDYDMIAVENLALHLRDRGTLSIVVPGKITFGGGRIKELRSFLQSSYCVKELAELPAGIFENTGVKTFLLQITTERTDKAIIKRYAANTDNIRRYGLNSLITAEDIAVSETELKNMVDWNIERIFELQDEDWIKFQKSSVKKAELGEAAVIFRGKAVKEKNPKGNIGVVNISNIGDYEIDYLSLDHIEEEERKISSYILKDGDLLIPARGTAIRTAIFKEQPYMCIASSNVIVIRVLEEKLSATYLKLFLDSPIGRKMLTARQQGTTVMNVSYKELNNMEIPLPSIDKQKEIAEEYNKELKIYKKSIQEAENRWSSALTELQKN
ncbi:MAG: restriction endonuclease subunit S [Clostridiales bacterium]|nr:restriction endonuclease subunit S [Clostridiales bacterium]